MTSDRDRWNEKYRAAEDGDNPPLALAAVLDLLPQHGHALDIAGGRGTCAAALAARGLVVTVADVSHVALEMATRRATRIGFELETVEIDLRAEPPPAGPWDLITVFHYLDRDIFPLLADRLAPDGLLVAGIATRTNLDRNTRPGPNFVLDDNELPTLLPDLDVIYHEEAWNERGSHEAIYVGRRSQHGD